MRHIVHMHRQATSSQQPAAAMAETATTSISVHVKSANGTKWTVSVAPEGTVPDLKVGGSID